MSRKIIRPVRVIKAETGIKYYLRELVERDGKLYIYDNNNLQELNKTYSNTIKDSSGASIGSIDVSNSKNISIPDASQTVRGFTKYSTTVPKEATSTGVIGVENAAARADHSHPLQTSVSGSAGNAAKLTTARLINLSGAVVAEGKNFDGSANINIPVISIDGSKITGTIPLSAIPKGAQERMIPVANNAARLSLTIDDAQNGDVVKVEDTGVMYYIVDDTKLGTSDPESAFSVFTAGAASSVDWSGITNKPVFKAVATSGKYSDLTGIPTEATTSSAGLMPASALLKLNNIAANANNYTHPTHTAKTSGLYKITVDSLGHISDATAVSKSDITALGIPGSQTSYSNATSSASGLMSSADKVKLDGIDTEANKTVIDSAISSTSTNPVQNKVIYTELAKKANNSHTHDYTSINFSGANGITPISRLYIPKSRSVKSYGLPAEAITVEYSTNGGSTWTDYGLDATAKKKLFNTYGNNTYLGKGTTSSANSINNMLRITIVPSDGRYVSFDSVYIYVSTNGNTLKFDLERSTIGAKTTFTKVLSNKELTGWGGPNINYFTEGTFGGSASQTSNHYAYRLIFKQTAISTSNQSAFISDIRFFGDNVWGTGNNNLNLVNNMIIEGVPYRFTSAGNIEFPDDMTIKGNFIGSVSGSIDTAEKLSTSTAGSATNPVYFSGGKPVACSYTLGKSIPSNALIYTSADTTPTSGSSNPVTSGGIFVALSKKADSSHTHESYLDASTSRTANTILAAPNGSSGAPTFRSLVANDVPSLSASKITSGTFSVSRGGLGVSTLASGEVLIGNGNSAVTTKAIDTTTGGTNGSTDLITSGAVYSALNLKSPTTHSHGIATTSDSGFLSAEDKTKLNSIENGANKITVDSAISFTSTNPLQNKVITSQLSNKASLNHTHYVDDINASGWSSATKNGGYDILSRTSVGSARSNKAFGLPSNAVVAEYSTNGGSTWTTISNKNSIFSNDDNGDTFIGNSSTCTMDSRLRFTISPTDGRCVSFDSVYIFTKMGSAPVNVKLESSTVGSKTTFTTVLSETICMNGANTYYFSEKMFGGTTTSNGYSFRITFSPLTAGNSTSIKSIKIFGTKIENLPSSNTVVANMLKYDRPYSIDGDGNTVFTGTFDGSITNANTASKLSNTSAIGSATKPVYFSSSGVPVACTYTLGKSIPSNAVIFTGTDTTPTSGSSNAMTSGGIYTALSDKASVETYTVSVPTTSWSGTSAPYTKTISVSGVLSTDTPIVDIVPSTTYSTAKSQLEAFSKVYRITTATNSITIYTTEKPTTRFSIQLKCIR